MTTSAKLSPPASRTRTERTSATPATLRTTRSTRPVRPDGARSMSTSTLPRPSRTAATSTMTATKIAATESPPGTPAAASPRPISTATVPAKSDPKCHAFAISAALRCRRPCRSDTVVRVASRTSTNTMTTNTYGRGLIGELPDCRRSTASTAIQAAAPDRNTASPRAARCCALPWP